MSGIHDPQLDVEPIPAGFESWFAHFMQLRKSERITYADVDAYQRVTGVALNPVELAAVFTMDRAANAVVSEMMKAKGSGKG